MQTHTWRLISISFCMQTGDTEKGGKVEFSYKSIVIVRDTGVVWVPNFPSAYGVGTSFSNNLLRLSHNQGLDKGA